MSTEASKDYSRGYQAGRKRTAAEQEAWDRTHAQIHDRRVARRDAFFCAALTGLTQSTGWSMAGEKVTELNEYVELARQFADRAIEVM